jgi:peptidoglycan/xylan/chitin deacetylase (PgdA/CDA1 family)
MNSLPILSYHSLDNSGSVITTSPKWFGQTLAALHSEGFRCINLNEWIEAGRPSVERCFAITFDDGLASIRNGAETIARFGFSATAFLVTDRMGLDNAWQGQPSGIPVSPLLGWTDLPQLRSAGFQFGAHSCSHPHFKRLDREQIRRQIVESRREIEQETGELCRLFAYPYGEAPHQAREIVRQEFAAGFGTKLGYATDRDPLSEISRVDSYYLRTPAALRRLLDGTWPALLRLLRTARAARRVVTFGKS